jgi:hypothetical protein
MKSITESILFNVREQDQAKVIVGHQPTFISHIAVFGQVQRSHLPAETPKGKDCDGTENPNEQVEPVLPIAEAVESRASSESRARALIASARYYRGRRGCGVLLASSSIAVI